MGTESIVLERELVLETPKESFIQNEMASDNPFVRVLYRDLEERLQTYETEGPGIERLRLSDLIAELIMAIAITGFLISVIL